MKNLVKSLRKHNIRFTPTYEYAGKYLAEQIGMMLLAFCAAIAGAAVSVYMIISGDPFILVSIAVIVFIVSTFIGFVNLFLLIDDRKCPKVITVKCTQSQVNGLRELNYIVEASQTAGVYKVRKCKKNAKEG